MVRGTSVGEKRGGKFDAAGNGDEEIDEQQGQQGAADFEEPARAPPADFLRVIENRPSFFHVMWHPPGAGGQRQKHNTPWSRNRPVYCKMRSKHEANFLQSGVPAA